MFAEKLLSPTRRKPRRIVFFDTRSSTGEADRLAFYHDMVMEDDPVYSNSFFHAPPGEADRLAFYHDMEVDDDPVYYARLAGVEGNAGMSYIRM